MTAPAANDLRPAMSEFALLALSPLDGRYAGKVDALRPQTQRAWLAAAAAVAKGF